MSLKRTFKAVGLFVALLATTQAVSALPLHDTYCCTYGCERVPASACPIGQGSSRLSDCLSTCP